MLTVLELPTLQWGVRWVQIEKLHEPPVTGSESMQSKIMLKFSASRKITFFGSHIPSADDITISISAFHAADH